MMSASVASSDDMKAGNVLRTADVLAEMRQKK
jgi:hypothetical protein